MLNTGLGFFIDILYSHSNWCARSVVQMYAQHLFLCMDLL